MLDKSSITKIAQKFVAKGQIDKAIAEWEKLLRESQEGNTYNIVGDLYLKKKSKREAIEAFLKAADIFREEGFQLKAMALYKKVLNLSPSEVNALIAVAEINAEKGLTGSANEGFITAADIYIKEGATEKVLELCKKVLESASTSIHTKIKVADLYQKIGLKDEVAKEYLNIALAYLEKGEDEKAEEFYQKIFDYDSENTSALIGLSRIAEKKNNPEQAKEYIHKVLSFDPENKEALFEYSELAGKTDDIDNAKRSLTKLVELDPSNNTYKKTLGNIYLQEGLLEKAWEVLLPYIDEALNVERWDEAFELLENFKEVDPITVKCRLVTMYKGMNNRDALIRELKALAEIYDTKDLSQNAFQSYKELLELNPSDETVQARVNTLEEDLGLKQVTEGKHGEVHIPDTVSADKKSFTPSAKEFSINFREKLTEADFYALQGLKDEAVKLYEELLKISPDDEEVLKKLETIKSTGEHEESVEEANEVETASSPAEDTQTDSHVKGILKEFKKGVDEKIDKKDYQTRYDLGIAYKEMGLLDDAIKEFQVTAKDPDRTALCSNMIALCYMDKKKFPSAIKEFKKVIQSMSPSDGGYLNVSFDLADAYVKSKEYEHALKIYTEIHERDSTFKDINRKIEILKRLMLEGRDKPKTKKDRVSYI